MSASLPAGYSRYTDIYGRRGVYFHIFFMEPEEFHDIWVYDEPNIVEYLETDESGSPVWKSESERTLMSNGSRYIVTPIPDVQMPEGGMTIFHNQFNETSQKWELPDIEADVHAHHERGHDSDVASATAALCGVELDIMHRRAVLRNLNPDQKAHANAVYADFADCIDNIVDANAEPAIERAWIKSHGGIKHTGDHYPERPYVTAAHDFAAAWLTHLNSRTKVQLGAARYEYNICVFRSLLADRGKTSNRFLPRGVTIVKRKSSPAKAEEQTAAQVFAKVKALVSPAEGAPKRA